MLNINFLPILRKFLNHTLARLLEYILHKQIYITYNFHCGMLFLYSVNSLRPEIIGTITLCLSALPYARITVFNVFLVVLYSIQLAHSRLVDGTPLKLTIVLPAHSI